MAKFSFCHYPPLSPFLPLFFLFVAPQCDIDKWQCKKRIYVRSWRLAHYHKQNRALSLCHLGAIQRVFGYDAWVKTHFWRSGDAVMPGQVWRKPLESQVKTLSIGLGAFSLKAHSIKERGTGNLPKDHCVEWFRATCRKCLLLYYFLVSFLSEGKTKHKTDLPHLQHLVYPVPSEFSRKLSGISLLRSLL